MAAPALVVRVAANLSELKENLKEGETALLKIGDASTGVNQKTQTLSSTYRQFDDVLRAAGINIGPQVKALDDIGKAATGGASKIGALGTVGLALGVGMAAWGITRAGMEFLGLDKSVESTWRRALGFADASEGAIANKINTLTRASTIAGREITNLGQAMKIIEDDFRRNANASIDWGQKLADAQREVRNLTDAQKTGIEVAQKAGATVQQITDKYGISADGLKALAESKKTAAAMSKAHEEALKKEKAATEAYNVEIANQRVLFDNLEKEAAASVAMKNKEKAAQDWINAMERSVIATNQQRAAEQALEVQTSSGAIVIGQTAAEYAAAGAAAESAGKQSVNAFAGVTQQVTLTGDAIREYINLMRFTMQANAINSENSLFQTASQRDRLAGLALPRAKGGPVLAGAPYMVGEKGPELFVPERSGTIVPNGAAGSLTIAPVIQVGGTDASPRDISAAVVDAILNLYRSGSLPMPASV